jgi:hypothetical protein
VDLLGVPVLPAGEGTVRLSGEVLVSCMRDGGRLEAGLATTGAVTGVAFN